MGEHALETHNELVRARLAYVKNDPPVEVNQRWVCFNKNGEVFRRIRIIALHPDADSVSGERQWIYGEEPAKMHFTNYSELRIVPEFNLRYVFKLESL